MLEQQLKKLNFYKAAKFEVKGKQLFVRSSDRTTLQEKTEEYFRKNRSEEHTSELQSRLHLVCRLLLEKKTTKNKKNKKTIKLVKPIDN